MDNHDWRRFDLGGYVLDRQAFIEETLVETDQFLRDTFGIHDDNERRKFVEKARGKLLAIVFANLVDLALAGRQVAQPTPATGDDDAVLAH